MPESLLALCAHVSAYKTIIKKWDDGDFSENTSIVNFPGEKVHEYASQTYNYLKEEQSKIIGKVHRSRVASIEAVTQRKTA